LKTLADFQKMAQQLGGMSLSKLASVAAKFGRRPAGMCLEGTVEGADRPKTRVECDRQIAR
jgi:hypothetical protein